MVKVSDSSPRDAIDACVDRIVESPHFSRSSRLIRFLRFTIDSMLEGRADELKERTIGIEVYGRPPEYDSREDSIVRSEAHRLRARLAAYYAREGVNDPILITLPKGSYVPDVRPNTMAPRDQPVGCRVLVADFEYRPAVERGRSSFSAIEPALRARLATRTGLRVMSPADSRSEGKGGRAHASADYQVDGVVERVDEHSAITLRITRLDDQKEIGFQVERLAGRRADEAATDRDMDVAAADLASWIASTVIGQVSCMRADSAHAHALYVKGRHSAILYANTFDPRHLESARRRLESAIESRPDYVDALAELANLELLCLYPPVGKAGDIVGRASALLERALASNPDHARSLYLLGDIAGSTMHPREALRLTESAVAKDPADPEGRTMLASRYLSLGFWESAVAACDWAMTLDPVWDAPDRIKAYVLTRSGHLDAARIAIESLERGDSCRFEVAIARFDLRLLAGDVAGAGEALATLAPPTPRRPDQNDRRAIALALVAALEGRHLEARKTLEAHLADGPRFWDHTLRLALALGEDEIARDLLLTNPINGSYRWLATTDLVWPYLRRPRWYALAERLHADWLRDLEDLGPSLPVPPPALPTPAALLDRSEPAPAPRTAALDY
jgi:hypothetical protein